MIKVGSSSVTTATGDTNSALLDSLCSEIASQHSQGNAVVVVTSGAIAAGWTALGLKCRRPGDVTVLQALSAVGQHRLMRSWQDSLAPHGLLAGQVLLAPLDFAHRQQYLQARGTLYHLLDFGVVPIINENDAVADEEIRFGDNDLLAALVAHLVHAELLVLLTDMPGLLTGDPRFVKEASLIEEVVEIDRQLELVAGGSGTSVGSGGMESKVAAAKIATWSGIETVIADAARPGVIGSVISREAGVGTVFRARSLSSKLGARKLWIAFALRSSGKLTVDEGARRALLERGGSLLPAGVVEISGQFNPDDAVEIVDLEGKVFAKGLVQLPSDRFAEWIGKRSSNLADDLARFAVHRDDMVILH